MKHLLLTIIAAVVLVGCGESQQSTPAPEAKPEAKTTKAPNISIHQAVEDGNTEAIKQRLASGVDVNVTDDRGMTPLHVAAVLGRKVIAELLISKGADVNANNAGGDTPLDYAIRLKRTEIATLLRKQGGKTGEGLKAEGK